MSALPKTFAGLRVLVAEDEAMATKLVRGALRITGVVDVVHCLDGAEAVKALDAEPDSFQLIISDWNMPTVSGLELLRYVRMHHSHVKFIMLTGRNQTDSVLQAKALGVDAYIAKPFSPDALKKRIEALFKF
jgi:two-component system, chemotaxis family, chemotaxis protein CheY